MLNNFKIGTRLYSLLAFLALLVVIVGFIGLHSAKLSNDALDTVYKDRVVPLKELKVIADMYAVNIVDTMLCKSVHLRYNNSTVLVNRVTGEVKYILSNGKYVPLTGVLKKQCQAIYNAQSRKRSRAH